MDIVNTQRLTPKQVLRIVHETCLAVAHMHSMNPPIIHRDLKVYHLPPYPLLHLPFYSLPSFPSPFLLLTFFPPPYHLLHLLLLLLTLSISSSYSLRYSLIGRESSSYFGL